MDIETRRKAPRIIGVDVDRDHFVIDDQNPDKMKEKRDSLSSKASSLASSLKKEGINSF